MFLPSLRANIISLSVIQAGNFLIPVLTFPYLARVLGAEGYGEVVWVQTIMTFGMIWVDFGFGWSATREISGNRADRKYVAEIFSNTWTVQWILLFVFALAVCVALRFINVKNPFIFLAGLGLVLGQVLFPLWLFQGLEALRTVALVQLFSKLFSLPFLFWLVVEPNDQLGAMLYFSISSMLVGIFSLIMVINANLIDWSKPTLNKMLYVFRDGAVLFSSRALISMYTTLVPLVIGWLAGPVQLAWFSLADRFKNLMQALMNPVSLALFPRMSFLFKNDSKEAERLIRKAAIGVIISSVLAGSIVWIFAEYCMKIFGGADFVQGASVLRWLAFVPTVVGISNILGVQIMLPLGMNRAFTLILAVASILSMSLIYPMVTKSGAQGAAELVMYVECFVASVMALYLWRIWKIKRILG